MYTKKPSVVYGFHAIDKDIGYEILNGKKQLKHSSNSYDWLGEGVYFWESNLQRACEYAKEDSRRDDSKIKTPFVLGAVIDLGNCLDLFDQKYLNFVKNAYLTYKHSMENKGIEMPTNGHFGTKFDFKKRELDCAVIRFAHQLANEFEKQKFDTVRAGFIEGDELYPNSGFREQNHIQIAVLNPDCIKGIFLPREKKTSLL